MSKYQLGFPKFDFKMSNGDEHISRKWLDKNGVKWWDGDLASSGLLHKKYLVVQDGEMSCLLESEYRQSSLPDVFVSERDGSLVWETSDVSNNFNNFNKQSRVWVPMSQDDLMRVQIGDELVINGTETTVTELYDRIGGDYGFDVESAVQLVGDAFTTNTVPFTAVNEYPAVNMYDEHIIGGNKFMKLMEQPETEAEAGDEYMCKPVAINILDNSENMYKRLFTSLIALANCYNGHSQLEISQDLFWAMTDQQRGELCDHLEAHLHQTEGYSGMIYIKTYPDKSGAICAGDYWKRGEHSLGHTDKLLLSFGS